MLMFLLLLLCCSNPLYGLEPWDFPTPDIQAEEVSVYPSALARRILISQPHVQLPESVVTALPGASTTEIASNHAQKYIELIGSSIGIKSFESFEVTNVTEGVPAGHVMVVMRRKVGDIPVNSAPTSVTIGPDGSVTEIQSSLIVLDDSIAAITNESGLPKSAIESIIATATGQSTEDLAFIKSISCKPPYLRWHVSGFMQRTVVDAYTGAILEE